MLFYIGILLVIILFCLHWKLSIIVQSIFLHRGAAHNMYELSDVWKKRFYIITFVALGPAYMSPWAYTILHRMHHAYADTNKDPHRPYNGLFGLWKTLWLTAKRFRDINAGEKYIDVDGLKVEVSEKFKKNVINWEEFDRLFHNWRARIFWILVYIITYATIINFFNLHFVFYGMVFVHSVLGPVHGAIVNYYGHKYGDRPHHMKNTSRNMPTIVRKILGMEGELLHENHHYDPSSPDFSLGNPKQVDPGYIHLLKLNELKVIKLNKKN